MDRSEHVRPLPPRPRTVREYKPLVRYVNRFARRFSEEAWRPKGNFAAAETPSLRLGFSNCPPTTRFASVGDRQKKSHARGTGSAGVAL